MGATSMVAVLTAADVACRLADLPVERLWGVGGAAARRLHAMGLRRFGDLQALSDSDAATLGEEIAGLRRLAMGIDERPVRPDREAKSIGSERTFGVDIRSDALLEKELLKRVPRWCRAPMPCMLPWYQAGW